MSKFESTVLADGVHIDMDGGRNFSVNRGASCVPGPRIHEMPAVLRTPLGMRVSEIVFPNWDGEGRTKMLWVRQPIDKMCFEWTEVIGDGPQYRLRAGIVVPNPMFHITFDPTAHGNDIVNVAHARNCLRCAFENYWSPHKDKPLKDAAWGGGVDGDVLSFGVPTFAPTTDLAAFAAAFVREHFKDGGSETFQFGCFFRVQEAFAKFADTLLRREFEWWSKMGLIAGDDPLERPEIKYCFMPVAKMGIDAAWNNHARAVEDVAMSISGSDGVVTSQREQHVVKTINAVPSDLWEKEPTVFEVMPGPTFNIPDAVMEKALDDAAAECRCKTLINGHEAGCPLAR